MKKFLLVLVGLALAMAPAFAFDNSPASEMVIPEADWAAATGGGTWTTWLQITSLTAGTDITVYFMYGGGLYRGPFTLYTGLDRYWNHGWTNILASIEGLDSGFSYYGRVGALLFYTQDGSHLIHVTARTTNNGLYGKTVQGLARVNSNYAMYSPMQTTLIQNLQNDSTWRTNTGFYNDYGYSITVSFHLVWYNNTTLGTWFNKTFAAWDFQSFNPFTQAGVPYPTYSYMNACLWVYPTGGSGRIAGYGSLAHNTTNDTAYQMMVQFQ
jgi:hypothetical protein